MMIYYLFILVGIQRDTTLFSRYDGKEYKELEVYIPDGWAMLANIPEDLSL